MKKVTVYPGDFAYVILGGTSTRLNEAIKAWAALVAREHAAWEEDLSRDEWNFLAELFFSDGILLVPAQMQPCEEIKVQIKNMHASFPSVVEQHTRSPGKLLANINRLLSQRKDNYAAGWALKLAVDLCRGTDISINDKWWTLEARARRTEKS